MGKLFGLNKKIFFSFTLDINTDINININMKIVTISFHNFKFSQFSQISQISQTSKIMKIFVLYRVDEIVIHLNVYRVDKNGYSSELV